MNYLPEKSSFQPPQSGIFWVPTNPRVWTLRDTQILRAAETAHEKATGYWMRDRWLINRQRNIAKQVKAPDVIYGHPPAGTVMQMRMFS